jgi:hypothetical protein
MPCILLVLNRPMTPLEERSEQRRSTSDTTTPIAFQNLRISPLQIDKTAKIWTRKRNSRSTNSCIYTVFSSADFAIDQMHSASMETDSYDTITSGTEITIEVAFSTQQDSDEQIPEPTHQAIFVDASSSAAFHNASQNICCPQHCADCSSNHRFADETETRFLPQVGEAKTQPQLPEITFISGQVALEPSLGWLSPLRLPTNIIKSLMQPLLNRAIFFSEHQDGEGSSSQDNSQLGDIEFLAEANDTVHDSKGMKQEPTTNIKSLYTIAADQQSISSEDSSGPNQWCIDVTVGGVVVVFTRFDTQSDSHFITRPALIRIINAGVDVNIRPIPKRKLNKYETPIRGSTFMPQHDVKLRMENKDIRLGRAITLKIIEDTDADQIIIGKSLLTGSFLVRVEEANKITSSPADGTDFLATLVKSKRTKSKSSCTTQCFEK